jgi:hypothetical protein
MSIARLLASQNNVNGYCLIATPVHVEVGMRNSECHALNKRDSYFTESQLGAFNDFFSGEFKLHPMNGLHYLLEFELAPEFILARKHWAPYLSDYRVQVQAAKGALTRYMTEMQAWCHQQESAWNALYLWSNSGQNPIPPVRLEDKSKNNAYALLNLISTVDQNETKNTIIGVDNLIELETSIPEIERSLNNGDVESVSFTFADNNLYTLKAENLLPWWKKFLIKI